MNDVKLEAKANDVIGLSADRRQALLSGLAVAATMAMVPGELVAEEDDATEQAESAIASMIRPLTGTFPRGGLTIHEFVRAMSAELGEDNLVKLAQVVRENGGANMAPAITAAGLDDLANRTIEILYTGIIEKDGKKEVLHFIDTLQWQVLRDFTDAPTTCGPYFGFWQDAPNA